MAYLRPCAFYYSELHDCTDRGVGRLGMFDLYSEVCGKAVVGNPPRPS